MNNHDAGFGPYLGWLGAVLCLLFALLWTLDDADAADAIGEGSDVPAPLVKPADKSIPKEGSLRVEKVSRPLSDQTMRRDQLAFYLASKRSYAESRGCQVDGFLTCQGQGARIESVPTAMDEGRYRPRPGTVRDYHD